MSLCWWDRRKDCDANPPRSIRGKDSMVNSLSRSQFTSQIPSPSGLLPLKLVSSCQICRTSAYSLFTSVSNTNLTTQRNPHCDPTSQLAIKPSRQDSNSDTNARAPVSSTQHTITTDQVPPFIVSLIFSVHYRCIRHDSHQFISQNPYKRYLSFRNSSRNRPCPIRSG